MVNFLLSLDIRTWNQNCTLQLCLGWHGHYALKQSSLHEEETKSCCCWLLLLLPKLCVVVDLLLLFCIIPVLLYYHDELMCGITIKTLNKVLFMCKIYELLITCLYFVHQQQSTWGGNHLLSGWWFLSPHPLKLSHLCLSATGCYSANELQTMASGFCWGRDSYWWDSQSANTEAANLKSLKPQPFVNVMWIMCVRNFKNLLLMNIKTW